ncbi:Glycerophosphodiester phosphodiesterase domain-containing protein [Dimargaris cristalligena]|uniref:Glycerophosphodiester phosphodiesterase domain-containing protein n=1 Tax=Dimargaris cristalligena TaxID=215637 RepID=A0A4P9ZZ63_9FUNG|nr:Glycerophosphodiester phosphodiesterase domain-containing protein [Dimargaris cristalligena]|eukprot:RKP39003.1 Glycerophosphodiester phosphodiesterase domain-containing protein [Dimargaris cristalligena]
MSLNSRAAYWKSLSTKVIGHRGSGMNRDASGGSNLQVGENTVLSFITAANLGAEYVEFDVQLTSDLTPVIYHDWTVTETGIDVPIHSLTKDQLREELNEELEKVLTHKKVPKKVKGNNAETIQAPFTTLAETFRQVPAHVGFNIEVKYPMKCEAQDAAVWSHVELNRFVDSILKVVYDLAGDRDVIFSSFHPDICLMLNVKQPSYPVFFLTDGGYYPYVDARCNSLQEAVRFAKHAGLLGIVSVSTLILQAPILAPAIKNQGLLLFTYGVLNNSVPCVQLQKQLEVDAVIVDSVMAVRKGLQDP